MDASDRGAGLSGHANTEVDRTQNQDSLSHYLAPTVSSPSQGLSENRLIGEAPLFNVRECPKCHEPNTNISGAPSYKCEVCGTRFKWEDATPFVTESLHQEEHSNAPSPPTTESNTNDTQHATTPEQNEQKADEVATTDHGSIAQASNNSIPQGVPPSYMASRAQHHEKQPSIHGTQGPLTPANSILPEAEFTAQPDIAKATHGQVHQNNQEREAHRRIQPDIWANLVSNADVSDTTTLRPDDTVPKRRRPPIIHPNDSCSQRGDKIRWNDPYGYQRPIVMGPVDPNLPMTPMLEDAIAAVVAGAEAMRERERNAPNVAALARQQEIDAFTPWQRFVWHVQLMPCWEAPGACCYKSPARAEDGTGHGRADGCCELMRLRGCCCKMGLQHCGGRGCCEGCGCVRCCGWRCGFWNICDGWFETDGCCEGGGCMACCGLRHGAWKALKEVFCAPEKKTDGLRGRELEERSWSEEGTTLTLWANNTTCS